MGKGGRSMCSTWASRSNNPTAEEIIRLSGMEPGKDMEIVYRRTGKLFEEILWREVATSTKHRRYTWRKTQSRM